MRKTCIADRTVKIIFLTASVRFVLDSYDVRAFSYLLSGPRKKPFSALREANLELPQRGLITYP